MVDHLVPTTSVSPCSMATGYAGRPRPCLFSGCPVWPVLPAGRDGGLVAWARRSSVRPARRAATARTVRKGAKR